MTIVPRVAGIDPGTVSIDVCALDDGRVVIDETYPTALALADPGAFVARLERAGPFDLVAGPSGYGLPLMRARDATVVDLRLAFLAADGESGGIGGLRSLVRALASSSLPVWLTPGVIHLPTVPAHRKVNRVDMGTADKVCAAALAIHEQSMRRRCDAAEVSFILLELGGAFTAALAVAGGRIVDGLGGTSGPLGLRAAGALDGEVAFLAGEVTKGMLFRGGAATIACEPGATLEELASPRTSRGRLAWQAYLENAAKAVASLVVAMPAPCEVILSGRVSEVAGVRDELTTRLAPLLPQESPVQWLSGFAATAKQGAQGAALLADGLAGGQAASLVHTLAIRDASGSALDHLHVISPAFARGRLGIS
jgi:predicted butyrate kinase (DUF1464 family)